MSNDSRFHDCKMLVVIVSCLKHQSLWKGITERLNNAIILCGGKETKLDGNILYLNCVDTYDGLSEKMMGAFDFILNSGIFKSVTHIFKADDHDTLFTTKQIEDIQVEYKGELESHDYIGQNLVPVGRLGIKHHYKKAPITSRWHNKPFIGNYTEYLGGGETYILSRKALECLVPNKGECEKYGSYEDAMVGTILGRYDIKPYKLKYGIKTWIG